MKHKHLIWVGAILLIVIVAGAIIHNSYFPHGKELVTKAYIGGNCGGITCKTKPAVLYANGSIKKSDGSWGHIDSDSIKKLQNYIAKTDFEAYKPALDPNCPSSADGGDLTYSFPSSKAKNKSFTACTLAISGNDPLFSYIEALPM